MYSKYCYPVISAICCFAKKLINSAFEFQNLPNVYLEFVYLLNLPTYLTKIIPLESIFNVR